VAEPPLFLDTNIWLRFFTRDDPAKAEACRQLFESAAQGDLRLTTNEMVLAELEWTLRSYYKLPKPAVVERLWAVLGAPALQLPRRAVVEAALSLYERHNVDYVDAYNAAELQARGLTTIASYDSDFDRLGVHRVEPAADG
jgi:predicted nucleic acid-binding protein